MTARPTRAIPRTLLALSVLAGVALWLTPAVLDLVITRSGDPVRVAMLPPLWQLPVFIFAGAIAIAAIAATLPKPGSEDDAGRGYARSASGDDASPSVAGRDETTAREGARDGASAAANAATADEAGVSDAAADSSADVLLPVAALGLLAVPYLPWLPDLLPITRLLAGPGRALLWIVVAALVARGFWRAVPWRVWLTTARPGYVAITLFAIGTAIGGATATVFTRTVLFPGGDEPHYLVIAQSLWRDHDLKIENNHRRGDYREYFEGDLRPHYLTRGVDREIYSIHPIGVSVLLAPVYAIGGYGLVVWVLAAMASGAGALAWLAALRATGSRGAATVAWLACCLNGPWIFNSFAVYPEVPAALMVICAWLVMHTREAGVLRWIGAGTALATLPWLSTKYAPMAVVLALVGLARVWWPDEIPEEEAAATPRADAGLTGTEAVLARSRGPAPASPPRADDGADLARVRGITAAPFARDEADALVARALGGPMAAAAGTANNADAMASRSDLRPTARAVGRNPIFASVALVVPFAIGLAAWFAFFYAIWGTFSPSAPYGTQRETRLAYLPAGGPGLLLDQEYGILAFVPALLLAFTGLAAMLASRGRARRLAIEIVVTFGALLATVGAFHVWWGGSATIGRPIVAGLLLLAIPFAWRYEQQRAKPALRAAYHVLIAAGLAIALALAFVQGGLLLAGYRNGISRLLEWLSPTWTLWTIAPTFVAQPPIAALATALIWIGVAMAAAWWLGRRPPSLTPGRATLAALLASAVALIVISIVVPLTGLRPPDPLVLTDRSRDDDDAAHDRARTSSDLLLSRLRMRSRSDLLDRFDAMRRPVAIAYDPFSRLDPTTAPSLVAFVARPTDRRPRPPLPLLYNARWSLPAGRYTVELIAGRDDAGRGSNGGQTNGSPASGSQIDGSLSLLVDYSGLSTRQWDVSMGSPGVWGRTFDLLTDVSVVGFRASPEIERAAPMLRIVPQAIVDVQGRVQPSEVTSAARLGGTTVYFHDSRVHAEGEGFWTPGSSTIMVTMAAPRAEAMTVDLRAGPIRTAAELSVHGWRERVLIEPNGERRVTLPASTAGVLRLFIETSTGFVPATLDPASSDRRSLGIWVAIPAQD